MITYKDIYEAAKKERYSENLQPIPKSFIKDVSKYLKEKREAASKEDDVFSDVLLKTKKQLENAITLFQELLRRRRKKILNLVLIASETGISKQDFENMLLLEKSLFEDLMQCIEKSDRKMNESLNGKKDEELQQNNLIVFLEDTPEFLSTTGEKFGPYLIGQFANIPKEIASVFLEDGKAELMEK
ncbi:DNA replication complex GINS family protein [archaeon]|nr:DNA replication complex GINS family protein [archaeon]